MDQVVDALKTFCGVLGIILGNGVILAAIIQHAVNWWQAHRARLNQAARHFTEEKT